MYEPLSTYQKGSSFIYTIVRLCYDVYEVSLEFGTDAFEMI